MYSMEFPAYTTITENIMETVSQQRFHPSGGICVLTYNRSGNSMDCISAADFIAITVSVFALYGVVHSVGAGLYHCCCKR